MSQLVQGMRAGLPVRFPGFKAQPEPLSARTVAATRSALTGSKLVWRHSAALTGPAVVASVAYMDPGNFATNIQAGSRYGSPRTEAERARMLRASNREVAVALGLAGLVNMAMVLMAAAAFHAGRSDIGEIATAYESLTPLLAAAAGTFQFERDVGECLRPLGADGAADIIDEHEVAIASCVR
jgi:hypothetical protein